MAKEALYLVNVEVDAAWAEEWNAWQAREHVPLVVKHAGFAAAWRVRHVQPTGDPVLPPRFTNVYRASGLGVIRTYLEGGEVGRMRAHHDAWIGGRNARIQRDVLEENYAIGAGGKPFVRGADTADGRAAFVVRVRVDPDAAPEWSVWYDREHMPKVVERGQFLRGGRYRVVDDAAGAPRFVVIYEAAALPVVAAFRGGPGPALSAEHEAVFGSRITIDREIWASA